MGGTFYGSLRAGEGQRFGHRGEKPESGRYGGRTLRGVYRDKNGWFYSSTGKATVKFGKKVYQVEAGYHQPLK